ncbi:unnamed protein product [Rotaria sordida]|uniref:Aminotransferase class V domain-containing protein n=1 Tax=Rotaria sordida TaxID=392033 RepID=A0A814GQR3_9BILA|nr:unnamed protein product [Rotaria sordida]CAF1013213.1 unnamed protein product [Rotaria sordida]CAF3708123.1 unnamed protein product [Rotaria sordida]CAF3850780.1 unnamed protein product [Rotaria sordida]
MIPVRPKLFDYIDENIIGKDLVIRGPWGPRKMIYADYTASGRCLRFFEKYMIEHVMPFYGNTHSENSACSLQTTKFRESARAIIKKSVNAKDDDVVIFTGSGSTGAIIKLVGSLHLNQEESRAKTVVFFTAFEHHSNILPWKETGVEMVRIPTNTQSVLDRSILKDKLEYYHNKTKKRIICTFSAASNVTGIRTEVDAISSLVHIYKGLVFWDYASAAPYLKIDMNASINGYKDAIFISTHKFIGGPDTPGNEILAIFIDQQNFLDEELLLRMKRFFKSILVAKKFLFDNRVPDVPSGGTVNFVTRESVEYVDDIETREEGGTPNILGSIRAGLVFHLKDSVGADKIEARENELVKRFFKRFPKNEKLMVLGSSKVDRLAIFSFLIYVPNLSKYLHHNFICSLLNDLFGIQVRSGCACAGPYVLDLLNIDDEKARQYTMFITDDAYDRIDADDEKVDKIPLIKPGFTRLNLPYFASDKEIEYILDALEFVANDGWKFLLMYTYDQMTGVWHPRQVYSSDHSQQYQSLTNITYENGQMHENDEQISGNDHSMNNFHSSMTMASPPKDPLSEARSIAANIITYAPRFIDYNKDPELHILEKYKDFIWFVLPKDIAIMILTKKPESEAPDIHHVLPFIPRHSVSIVS